MSVAIRELGPPRCEQAPEDRLRDLGGAVPDEGSDVGSTLIAVGVLGVLALGLTLGAVVEERFRRRS